MPTILVVDDNPDRGDVLTRIPARSGYAAERATDGATALDLVRECRRGPS